jgi:hypothetical protein
MAALIKKLPFMVFCLLFIAVTASGDVAFVEHLIDNYSYGNPSLYACDIDDDGDQDVVGAVLETGDVAWWRNDGGYPISWEKTFVDYNVPVAFSVYAEDVDGDGHKDILATAYYAGLVLWWKSSGQAPYTWTRYVVADSFDEAHEVYACDIDDDGDTDVMGASSGLSRISLWLNEGGDPIEWTEVIIDDDFDTAKSVRAADIDGDGIKDIIGAAIYGNDVAWWHNDGNDPITWTKHFVDDNFIGAHRVEAVDLDLDGDNDIVGAGCLGHEIAWWRNNGGDHISWTKQTLETGFINACVAMPGDIDGDGDIDVAATAQGIDEVAWWENDGDDAINWTKHMIDDVLVRPWPMVLVDLDGDGDLDAISGSSHQGCHQVKWYENTGTTGTDYADQPLPSKSLYSYNSPNPFNRSTDIVISLPSEAEVSIDIYNLIGGLILSDETGTLSPGTHRFPWNAGNLPSGIYFYRIRADGISGDGKMLLLK